MLVRRIALRDQNLKYVSIKRFKCRIPKSRSVHLTQRVRIPERLNSEKFSIRHIGPRKTDQEEMLRSLGCNNLEELISQVIPENLRSSNILKNLPQPLSEVECLKSLKKISEMNVLSKSYIGMGFYNSITPQVIIRNILQNPGWYTPYTPYQAEISQGRMESLLNFQSLICDLTGLPISNASLLDPSSACVEAITLSHFVNKRKEIVLLTTEVAMLTRAKSLGLSIKFLSSEECLSYDFTNSAALFIQYPNQYGELKDVIPLIERCHQYKSLSICSTDIMSLALLKPPGELGFDITVGNTQRFGIPLGYGGPHASFIAVKEELKRQIPGRIIGRSIDKNGKNALRLALQTREQHIRRDKALLANMASMFAMHHGSEGIKKISTRIHLTALKLRDYLDQNGFEVSRKMIFDTVYVSMPPEKLLEIKNKAESMNINFRYINDSMMSISLDETVGNSELSEILLTFNIKLDENETVERLIKKSIMNSDFKRESPILKTKIFSKFQSETELMRYMKYLENKDVSLMNSMIPLGSCTMKLNSAVSMMQLTEEKFNSIHPYVPSDQVKGYKELVDSLGNYLKQITGMEGVSFHSNSGAQGEYLGLLAIKGHLNKTLQNKRNCITVVDNLVTSNPDFTDFIKNKALNLQSLKLISDFLTNKYFKENITEICLVPKSAHGTNPASARLAGFKVVPIETSKSGGICKDDLNKKLDLFGNQIGCAMITFPSTSGIFDDDILEICQLIKKSGAQIYMDGANMNAQVGLCAPGSFGVDVCHLNLHKTFSIPHGGGGPGMAPICVKEHLIEHLPKFIDSSHLEKLNVLSNESTLGNISSSIHGSSLILTIPWAYIRLMGAEALTEASSVAILNANYAMNRISKHYNVLFKGSKGRVAHEFIIDLKSFKESAGIETIDVAKRLIDYGFHPPTMSWPVLNTLMVEPTESESKEELDRFCDALISIRKEIRDIENGLFPKDNNMLKNAPHDIQTVISSTWDKPYSREFAAFPLDYLRKHKIWPAVSRIDDVYGDKNLFCTCE